MSNTRFLCHNMLNEHERGLQPVPVARLIKAGPQKPCIGRVRGFFLPGCGQKPAGCPQRHKTAKIQTASASGFLKRAGSFRGHPHRGRHSRMKEKALEKGVSFDRKPSRLRKQGGRPALEKEKRV